MRTGFIMTKREQIEMNILNKDAQVVFYMTRRAYIMKMREEKGKEPKEIHHIMELIYAAKKEKKFWEEQLSKLEV